MKRFVDSIQGERMLPSYAALRQLAGFPNCLRPALSWVLRNVLGDERRASIVGYEGSAERLDCTGVDVNAAWFGDFGGPVSCDNSQADGGAVHS